MKIDTEKMLTKIRTLEAAAKRLNEQGVRCSQCMHLEHCAKEPGPKGLVCICFETKVVLL